MRLPSHFGITFIAFVMLTFFASACIAQASDSAIQVDVIYPDQMQSSSTISLSGTVEAKQHSQLAALEPGLIQDILVEVGDEVVAGQTLLELNADLATLSLQSARASAQAAQVNLEEAKRLYNEVLALSKQQVVAQTLIAERAALVANAEADIARTQADVKLQAEVVKRHALTAPFSGVIASRDVDIGEWITQQSQVFTLVDQEHLRLSVEVPQQYYALLAKGKNIDVLVQPDINSLSPVKATLSRLVPVSNRMSRTFLAQIDLPSQLDWVAGISARADIRIPNSNQGMIVLPISAVKQHPDGGSSVFVVENGKAKRIITPYTNLLNGEVSILGQAADNAYVVSGVELLRDGMAVVTNNVSVNAQNSNTRNSSNGSAL